MRNKRKQDEKIQAEEKNCPTTAKASCQNAASFEIKEEVKEEEPNENYRLAMKIIQEGLNHIKGDPRTSSHVISAIKVLEDEANEEEEDEEEEALEEEDEDEEGHQQTMMGN